FIVAEEERLIFFERASDCRAVLVLAQYRIRSGQWGPGIELIIHSEVVRGAAELVRARLSDYITEPPSGPPYSARYVLFRTRNCCAASCDGVTRGNPVKV